MPSQDVEFKGRIIKMWGFLDSRLQPEGAERDVIAKTAKKDSLKVSKDILLRRGFVEG